MKKSGLLGSVVLASILFSTAQAEVKLFGHVGTLFNYGFGDYRAGNLKNDLQILGATGHLGLDFKFSDVSFGVGTWAGSKIFSANGDNYNGAYGNKYVDLSDLYFKYDGAFTFAVGRFDGNFLRADWIDNYIQGAGASFGSEDMNFWLTWANDYSTFGVQPGRIASELAAYTYFPSTYHGFDVGTRDVIGVGANLKFGAISIDPFAHYWLSGRNGDNLLQAGAKLGIEVGSNSFKSITSLRFMWQNFTNNNSWLAWGDEELRVNDIFKFGAGLYAVGKESGIIRMTDHSRFYGRYTTPYYSAGQGSYFGANQFAWYAFAGVEHERFKFDLLYAGGDYSEFSAVASVRVFNTNYSFMREGLALDLGGGYVNNGFGNNIQSHNAIAFAKLVF